MAEYIKEAARQADLDARYKNALWMVRTRDWPAPGKRTVTNPKYGKVVVPHESMLAAIENAVKYWGCPIGEITLSGAFQLPQNKNEGMATICTAISSA